MISNAFLFVRDPHVRFIYPGNRTSRHPAQKDTDGPWHHLVLMDQNGKVEASTGACPAVSYMGPLLQAHLQELLFRKAEVEKRVGTLRLVLKGLEQMEGWVAVIATEPEGSDTLDLHSARARNGPVSVVTLPTSQNSPQAICRKSNYFYSRLRRACRIALLEGERSGTAEDIYARIVRRGSLSAADQQRGVASISAALSLMATDAEVRVVGAGSHKTWALSAPPEYCEEELKPEY